MNLSPIWLDILIKNLVYRIKRPVWCFSLSKSRLFTWKSGNVDNACWPRGQIYAVNRPKATCFFLFALCSPSRNFSIGARGYVLPFPLTRSLALGFFFLGGLQSSAQLWFICTAIDSLFSSLAQDFSPFRTRCSAAGSVGGSKLDSHSSALWI